ncbi:hypothetical protein Taro_005216 [Colocasia esculenta]|uniref:Uncharacterized protein n=1 Tax=Colocasia esculenta TaxID=4460 RepID=A0A843TKB4_COLES|nr:hypothetical protein [Colocasia esculenta]
MGNCMPRCPPAQEEQEPKEVEAGSFEAKVTGNNRGESGFKIKVLLTKGELEWLLLQLKENGEKRLEDMLGEIERGRGKGKIRVEGSWKPSLESIMEIPEVQSF